ncbi:hypothetical protein C8J57DRAFT_1470141 [Mycena rebaudengoi]|nr:hypothetical protein C8J57DRAFT_1470141 [Mycena rebaudengoi]
MNESVDETVRRARVEGFMLTWFKRQLELSCIAAGNEVVLGRLSELEAVGQRFDQDGVYGCADTMEIIRIRIPTEFGQNFHGALIDEYIPLVEFLNKKQLLLKISMQLTSRKDRAHTGHTIIAVEKNLAEEESLKLEVLRSDSSKLKWLRRMIEADLRRQKQPDWEKTNAPKSVQKEENMS